MHAVIYGDGKTMCQVNKEIIRPLHLRSSFLFLITFYFLIVRLEVPAMVTVAPGFTLMVLMLVFEFNCG